MSILEKCIQDSTAKLHEIGFRKRAGEVYTYEPADGYLGWLGLNRAKRGAAIEINPVIGIRCQEIERHLAELLGQKVHRYLPPTISVSLGYLMPEKKYRAWFFESESDLPAVVELVGAVQRYAVPFINASTSLEAIKDLLESPIFSYVEHSAYRIPLVLFLLGRESAAKDSCMSYLSRLKDRNDLAAIQYRKFAQALGSFLK